MGFPSEEYFMSKKVRGKKSDKNKKPLKTGNAPSYTLGEEIFGAVSHGVGGLLAIAGTVVLIVLCAIYGGAWEVVSACIYGASLIILYTMSTLYHAITHQKAKAFFRIMDHNTIFFLIAGTYTPFTLVTLRGALGWVLFGIIWGAAILGIVLNSVNLEKYKKISVIAYLVMGWAIIFAIKPFYESVDKLSLIFLVIGGALYSIGVIFYKIKKVKYFHAVWHLFVIAGSIFHYFAVLVEMI